MFFSVAFDVNVVVLVDSALVSFCKFSLTLNASMQTILAGEIYKRSHDEDQWNATAGQTITHKVTKLHNTTQVACILIHAHLSMHTYSHIYIHEYLR